MAQDRREDPHEPANEGRPLRPVSGAWSFHEIERRVSPPGSSWPYALPFVPLLLAWVEDGAVSVVLRDHASELISGVLLWGAVRRLTNRSLGHMRLAETDALTGLGNRLRFERTWPWLVKQARKRGAPLSVAYVDFNNFKKINDTYGHSAGDQALSLMGSLLQESARSGAAMPFRMGGDEFCIIFAGTASSARQLMEDVFRSSPVRPRYDFSCSVGIANVMPNDSVEEALDRAEARMYSAKRTEGRFSDDFVGSDDQATRLSLKTEATTRLN